MTSFEKLSVSSMTPEESEGEKVLETLPFVSQCGSFENQFGRNTDAGPFLSFSRLKQLTFDFARELVFPQSFEKSVIYSDFKASNILLGKKIVNKTSVELWGSIWHGSKEDEANDVDKMTSQMQYKNPDSNLNKYGEAFNSRKCKETVQRVSRNVTAIIVLLWIILEINKQSSNLKLQVLQKQHAPVFICSSLLEMFCFMVFGWTVAATITAGPPFSRMQSAMLMFWAILMLIRSAKSITEIYVPTLGIIFMGCYMLLQKQPTH